MDTIQNSQGRAFKNSDGWSIQTLLKSKLSGLTDEDLHLEKGKANDLISRISARLEKGREERLSRLKKARMENRTERKIHSQAEVAC